MIVVGGIPIDSVHRGESSMLTIFGKPHARGGFCDGATRRDFLTVGGTLLGGALSLPRLLAAEAKSGTRTSHKAVINIYLPGGPPHLDMFDLKPDAPAEVRGEFKPIQTNVPGIDICEHFPRLAKMMDKFVVVRSLVGSSGDHDAYQGMTGRKRDPREAGFWPSMGAWVSKVQGPVDASIPAHLTLMYRTGEQRWGYPGEGGFLGLAHAPFRLVGGKENNMKSDNLVLKGVQEAIQKGRDRSTAEMGKLTGGMGIPDYVSVPGTLQVAPYDMMTAVTAQTKGAIFTLVFSGVGSFILFKVVDLLIGLRPNLDVEREGLDLAEHGERAYSM